MLGGQVMLRVVSNNHRRLITVTPMDIVHERRLAAVTHTIEIGTRRKRPDILVCPVRACTAGRPCLRRMGLRRWFRKPDVSPKCPTLPLWVCSNGWDGWR